MSHDHDHDHDPIDESPVATRVREARAIGSSTRESSIAKSSASGSTGSCRAIRRTARASSRAPGWIRSSSSDCSQTRARPRSRSASTPGRRRPSSRSRTPRTCTTWSSARSARATRRPCSARRPTGTRACPYRSRAVSDPRGVLREFGVELPDEVEVRVVDSTADVRYLVIPRRPAGTEDLSEDELAALVTRDSMIGVAQP